MSPARSWIPTELPFERLSPQQFERFCHALLRAEGHTDVRHWGAAGSEKGCDLVSTGPDGRRVVTQCKRVEKLGPKAAVAEVEKVLAAPPDPPPGVWSLVATRAISREVEEAVKEAVGDAVEVSFSGLTELDARARDFPDLVEWFFGPALGAAVEPPTWWVSASVADQAWAEAFAADLQACLRQSRPDVQVELGIPSDETPWPEVPAHARWGVVIATPTALADSRLRSLWRDALCQPCSSGGPRRLLALSLEPAPWPPWLEERFQRLDLEESPDSYRIDLSKIISKYIGWTEKNELPELQGPGEAAPQLPPDLRRRLVSWMEPWMTSHSQRRNLAAALSLGDRKVLDDFETLAVQASVALALHTAGDDAVAGALRTVSVLLDEAEDETGRRLKALKGLEQELEELQATRPERQDLLTAWLDKVAADHRRLVAHFQQEHELDLLDRVYVELDLNLKAPELQRELIEEASEDASPRLGHRGWTLRRLLSLDPQAQPWVTRRWVVKGDPGSGKTTLLRHLAASLAREQKEQSSPPLVPVFQSLPAWIRDGRPLLERLARSFEASGGEGLDRVLDRLGEEGRLLVLLDGLDEVSPEVRPEAESRIRQLAQRWPGTPMVVTTRPIGYRRFAGDFQEVQLLPLERPQRREFLALWFGRFEGERDDAKAEEALQELDDPSFEELAGNPLYLTLMAMLIEDPDSPSPSSNRAQLYDQVFRLLLEGKHKLGLRDRSFEPIARPELVRRVLRCLAESMTLDNRDSEAKGELEDRLYRRELEAEQEEMRKVRRWDRHPSQFLDDVAEKVGILGPHDGEDADWRFWHRTFREALVAERMAEWPEERVLSQAQAVQGQESRWAEPFALLCGQAKDPDALLRRLLEANRALALRALATAQRVTDDFVVEAFELTDDWQERSKVFEKLPDQIGDADRCLRLIDRLRKGTTNGNDLYFLDRAASLVGQRWQSFAGAARKTRSELYDHISPADPELLRRWRRPDGKELDLWQRIPEGVGWVGKREDEEGEDRESPRHRVQITRPFWLGAVPVTNRLYAAFDEAKPVREWHGVQPAELADHPRVALSWYEAVSFCRWLATQPGFEDAGPALPEEEVWEVACRARTETRFFSGDDDAALDAVGWFEDNSEGRPHRVGGKKPNAFGLYDVHGNVWEWTVTEFDESRCQGRSAVEPFQIDPSAPSADLAGSPRVRRVLRGGCCWFSARWCRSACRDAGDPGGGFGGQGFRVLLSSAPSAGSAVDPRS